MRNSLDCLGSDTALVDAGVGTAYSVVRAVYLNLQKIAYVAANLDALRPSDVEFQESDDKLYLQWRYTTGDDTTWKNLLPLTDISGKTPEIQINADGILEWKYTDEDDTAWKTLWDVSGVTTQVATNTQNIASLQTQLTSLSTTVTEGDESTLTAAKAYTDAIKTAVGYLLDSAVSTTSALYDRLTDWVSPCDPAYGAKFDAVRDSTGNYVSGTDDTAAIQACLNENVNVYFPGGKCYYSATGVDVPSTLKNLNCDASWGVGPGYTSGISAFRFTSWNQGGGDVQQRGEKLILPSVQGFHALADITNSGFLHLHADTVRNCVWTYYSECTTAENYCMENDLSVRHAWHLRNSDNTAGGVFAQVMSGTATSSFQGNRGRCFYADDVFAAVYQSDTGTTGTGGNINNAFEIFECDQSLWAIYNTSANLSANLYSFPAGLTSMQQHYPFKNLSKADRYQIGGVTTNDPAMAGALNFNWIGASNRAGIAYYTEGTPTFYVDPTGSDSNPGNDTAPFATIQRAFDVLANIDLFGQTAYIALRATGGNHAGATFNGLGGQGPKGTIQIIGDSGAIIGGRITANGVGADVSLSNVELTSGGVYAQNSGVIQIGSNVVFDAYAGGDQITADTNGKVILNQSYKVTGLANCHMSVRSGGRIINNGATSATFTGTLPFATAVLWARDGSLFIPGLAFTGAGVSGIKYYAGIGGVIWTNGQTIVGTTDGTTELGGVFA